MVRATRDGEVLGLPSSSVSEEMIWSKAFVQERERFDGAIYALIYQFGEGLEWRRLNHRFDVTGVSCSVLSCCLDSCIRSTATRVPSAGSSTSHRRRFLRDSGRVGPGVQRHAALEGAVSSRCVRARVSGRSESFLRTNDADELGNLDRGHSRQVRIVAMRRVGDRMSRAAQQLRRLPAITDQFLRMS